MKPKRKELRHKCKYPFTGEFIFQFDHKQNRRCVIVYDDYRPRIKMTYARYLASVREGRWLSRDEHVHHIDEDQLNDSIDNLQILKASDHVKLHKPTVSFVKLVCPNCNMQFEISEARHRDRMKRVDVPISCSSDCAKRATKILRREIYNQALRNALNDLNKNNN